MLLERNQTVIGTIVVLVVALGTWFAVVATGGGFAPGKVVHAEFADAAGLEEGNYVYVAGVRVGRVDAVEVVTDCATADGDVACVRVDLKVDADVPADSSADIGLQNALGKRIVRILPGTSATTMESGATITLDRTDTPVDIPELGDETVDLLEESDIDALNVLTTALADVTDGAQQDVADLLDGVERLSKVIADRRDDLALVIERSSVFLEAAASRDGEIVRIIDAFGSTLDRLADRRVELRTLLRETALATDISADLVESQRTRLDRVLAELHTDLEILDDHQVDLAHFFAYAGVSVEGFAGIGYGGGEAKTDNPAWGNVHAVSLGAANVDALIGCGSAVDEFLTAVVGPDPACTGEADPGAGASADARPSAFSSFRGFFTVALHRTDDRVWHGGVQ